MFPISYPLGMGTYNNTSYLGGSPSWKGSGEYSNPVAITAKNIRPLTNNDVTNDAPQKFGLARPLKIYRKGTVTPIPGENSNFNRAVKSSNSASLIGQLIDRPGTFSVKENIANTEKVPDYDCKTCDGISLVADYYPSTNLTNNPRPITEQIGNCCNEHAKLLIVLDLLVQI